MTKRKTLRMVVTVTVPIGMSASQARLEVRTLINDQTTYYADHGDVKARGVRALPRDVLARAML